MSNNQKKSIVFIRLDKIGDLIATLPVDQLLNTMPKWVVAKGLGQIIKAASPAREFIEIENSKKFHRESYEALLNFLKNENPRAVVVFYAPWWVSLACYRAGVPLRIGRLSQWHSFLFFNKGIRQQRTLAEKHEAEYNRDLVEQGLGFKSNAATPVLQLHAESNPQLLEKFNLNMEDFVVVHPGMFGSALNWPQSYYIELISELVKSTVVTITGTVADERFLNEIKIKFKDHDKVRILQNQLSMTELLSILQMSSCVIAPSTGVLHLAASLGKFCIGIYSPIRVHHPRRWGPRGPLAHFLLPEVNCPAEQKCLGESCQHYPCMNKISAHSLLKLWTANKPRKNTLNAN
jgi:ADP-heptose:LPS heptosyltransferase